MTDKTKVNKIEPLFPRSTFRNEQNMIYTMGLFHEFKQQCKTTPINPIYNLKKYDWKGTLSMYLIYLDCSSEYEAAIKLLGDWDHWRRLCSCNWFKPYIESWREEVIIREAALGKAVIINKANEGNLSAAKELLGQVSKGRVKGKPTNEQKSIESSRMKEVDKKVVNILSRMRS